MDDPLTTATNMVANDIRGQRSMMDFALMYAHERLRVLPLQSLRSPGCCTCGSETCRSIAKHPRTWNGVKDASRAPEQIREWWRLYPDANIGIATGHGLLVIDIDPKNGGSLEALNALVALPSTATVRTGGGGFHLYFVYDRKEITIRNSASKLAPGIDVRGENGYVVAPPSLHASGNRYWWDRHAGYAEAPLALLDRLVEHVPLLLYNDASQKEVATTQAPEPKVAASPRFVSEGKRNSTLVSIAGSLRNQGANEEALFIVLQAMNKGCCQPPLAEDEVRQICKSAFRWAQGSNGNSSGRKAMVVKSVAALMAEEDTPAAWTIPGLLPEGVSLLAGKPKMGKSWLALDLAISIAQGDAALGRLPTNQGSVLYIGMEDNEQRLRERIKKLRPDNPSHTALFWSGDSPSLTHGGLVDMEAWIAAAAHPRLVVIDTLARVRAQSGNSSGSIYADDYATIVPLKQLAEQYHLSILVIHHLRKSGASDPMDEVSGSTGLTGATDCNMVLQRERGQDKATLHISGRDVEDQELHLRFDGESGHWSFAQVPAASSTSDLAPGREAIRSLLVQKGQPLSPSEIAEELQLDQSSVRKKLSLMKKAGQVQTTGRGLYHVVPDDTTE